MNGLHSVIRFAMIVVTLWALCWSGWMAVAYADDQLGAIGSGLALQLPAIRADAPDAGPLEDPEPPATTAPQATPSDMPPPPVPAPATVAPQTPTPSPAPQSNSATGITTPEPRG